VTGGRAGVRRGVGLGRRAPLGAAVLSVPPPAADGSGAFVATVFGAAVFGAAVFGAAVFGAG
jgi:hypothetical protein